jgi:hypothetical protein
MYHFLCVREVFWIIGGMARGVHSLHRTDEASSDIHLNGDVAN